MAAASPVYDLQNVLMTHQTTCNRHFSTPSGPLQAEYLEVCSAFADDDTARKVHARFVMAVEGMRSLLNNQRAIAKQVALIPKLNQSDKPNDPFLAFSGGSMDDSMRSDTSRASSVPHSIIGGNASTAAGTVLIVVPDSWSKNTGKALYESWNRQNETLALDATEAAVAWLLDNSDYEQFDSLRPSGRYSCYCKHLGLVLQQWEDPKDAKDFVNALHAVVNAPLAELFTPFACTFTVLGQTIVAMSLAPVQSHMERWGEFTYVTHNLNAICASLRLVRTTFPKNLMGSDSVVRDLESIKAALIGQYAAFNKEFFKDVRIAFGADARTYVLDGRSLVCRGHSESSSLVAVTPTVPGPMTCPCFYWTPFARRFPRRECLFSASGNAVTPYSPEQFIARFKLKAIAEYLTQSADALMTEGVLLSSVLHVHGLTYGPHLYPLFFTVDEVERVYLASVNATNRRNAPPQGVHARIQRTALAKALVVTDALARVIKRIICEEWRRVAVSAAFREKLRAALRDDGSNPAASDRTLRGLNAPFVESANNVLSLVFCTDPHTGAVQLAERCLSELMFLLHDTYVRKMTATLGEGGGDTSRFTFDVPPADIAVPHMIRCLEVMLGVRFEVSLGEVQLSAATTNVFDAFFDLDAAEACVLRSAVLMTSVELPTALSGGSKGKVQEYATLQHRVASKVVSMIDVTWPADLLVYTVNIAKFVFMHTDDIVIGHRGHITDRDFEDIAAMNRQVPQQLSARAVESETCFDADTALRRAWYASLTDIHGTIRQLLKYTDKVQSLRNASTTEAVAAMLISKLRVLGRVSQKFSSGNSLHALETALQELDDMAADGGRVSGHTGPSPRHQQKPLRSIHIAAHMVQNLSLLVRFHASNMAGRSRTHALTLALRYATARRDMIILLFGERSMEAGVACNDIAAVCSNSKFDLQRAEEEFERAIIILAEVQPEGPAVFVTMNNLAFLFFRRYERMRRVLTGSQEGGGFQDDASSHPSEGEIGTGGKGKVSLVTARYYMVRAEELLKQVIHVKEKLPVADVGAALNNLASIKLSQQRFGEAKRLFAQTLEITPAATGEKELPCRAHAVRNLKVLARQQYIAAVLRVQLATRRFLKHIREKRWLRQEGSIFPVQCAGRAYLRRLAVAKLYRFSGYYFWMRQPRLFTRKLPITSWSLPLSMREREWWALVSGATERLQRLGRAAAVRLHLAPFAKAAQAEARARAVNVQQYFRHRLQLFEETVASTSLAHRRACAGAQSALLMPMAILEEEEGRRGVLIVASLAWMRLVQDGEHSSRAAVAAHERREFATLAAVGASTILFRREAEGRCRVLVEASLRHCALFEEGLWARARALFRLRFQASIPLLELQALESKMRQRLECEQVAAACGERVAPVLARWGRAFAARRLLGGVNRLLRRERLSRQDIVVTFEDSPVVPRMRRTMLMERVVIREDEARRGIATRHAAELVRLKTHSLPATLVGELNRRTAIEREADEGCWLLQRSEGGGRVGVVEGAVRRAIVTASLLEVFGHMANCGVEGLAALRASEGVGRAHARLQELDRRVAAFPAIEATGRAAIVHAETVSRTCLAEHQRRLAHEAAEADALAALLRASADIVTMLHEREVHATKCRAERAELHASEADLREKLLQRFTTERTQALTICLHRAHTLLAAHTLVSTVANAAIAVFAADGQAQMLHTHVRLLTWRQEKEHRMLVDAADRERLYGVTIPCQHSLTLMRRQALDGALRGRGRVETFQEEQRERFALAVYHIKLLHFMDAAEDPAFQHEARSMLWGCLGVMEFVGRRALWAEETRGRLALVAAIMVDRQRCMAQRMLQMMSTRVLMWIAREERVFRRAALFAEVHTRALLFCQHVEGPQRAQHTHAEAMQRLVIALAKAHAEYVLLTLVPWLTRQRADARQKLTRGIMQASCRLAEHTVAAAALGFTTRQRLGRQWNEMRRMCRVLQAAGRGFLGRARVHQLDMQAVQRVLVMVCEGNARGRLEGVEEAQWADLQGFGALRGPAYLRSLGLGGKAGKDSSVLPPTSMAMPGSGLQAARAASSPRGPWVAASDPAPEDTVMERPAPHGSPLRTQHTRAIDATTQRLYTPPQWSTRGLFAASRGAPTDVMRRYDVRPPQVAKRPASAAPRGAGSYGPM